MKKNAPVRPSPAQTSRLQNKRGNPLPRRGGTHLPPAARCCPALTARLSPPGPAAHTAPIVGPAPPRSPPALPRPLAPGSPPRSRPANKVGSRARRGGEGVRDRVRGIRGRSFPAWQPGGRGGKFLGRGWYLPGAAGRDPERVRLGAASGRAPGARGSAGQGAGAALPAWDAGGFGGRRSCHAERIPAIPGCDGFIPAARIAPRYRGAGSIVPRTACVQIQKRQE